jgi:hypothetical protein
MLWSGGESFEEWQNCARFTWESAGGGAQGLLGLGAGDGRGTVAFVVSIGTVPVSVAFQVASNALTVAIELVCLAG